jgi:hypothetical protein
VVAEEVEEVLVIFGGLVVGRDDGDGHLSELLKVHVDLFVLVVDAGSVAVDVQVLQEQVVRLQGILLPSVDSEDEVDPVMQVGSYVLTLQYFAHFEDVLVLVHGPPG